ncbi:hypothetical protein B4135_3721 [Caldibacillus debilis]|uniref:Uncharacterized protein n=1 Tax=Caldibacillus debilis TaxID=301148 RepID=A0A150LAQ2_9BACI|nr:hypothetical protein B4135_3721 [Caldibacillus debilis]
MPQKSSEWKRTGPFKKERKASRKSGDALFAGAQEGGDAQADGKSGSETSCPRPPLRTGSVRNGNGALNRSGAA